MSVALAVIPPPAWTKDALCATYQHPDLWFPHPGDAAHQAKAICADCPVRLDCLSHALEHKIRDGVWGGMADGERRRLIHDTGHLCAQCGEPIPAVRIYCGAECKRLARNARYAARRRGEVG